MTITPERLAELRKGLATSAAWGCTTEQVNVEELRDLLDAADHLNALLAAAESYAENGHKDDGRLPCDIYLKHPHAKCDCGFDELRAAIRRARGEP